MEGWIKMYRKLLESEIWNKKPSSWFKIWQFILLSVNHKDNNSYKMGTNFFNFSEICRHRAIGKDISLDMVEHCIKWLKSAEQIAVQKTTRGAIVTVLNYSKYQQEAEISAESKRNRSGTINKNDKNDKNIHDIAKTSKNSVIPCTEQELQAIASKLQVGLEAVKNKHSVILNKIEAREFKNKTVYLTLENWILGDIEKGYIKRITSSSIAAKYPLYQPKAI